MDLNANTLAGPAGTAVPAWTNNGAGGIANFTQPTVLAQPRLEIGAGGVAGLKAVTFDAGSDGTIDRLESFGTVAPADVTGSSNFTVEAWVFNPAILAEEAVLNWALRGGPDRTCAQLNYGNHATWGAGTHWGAVGDIGFDAGVPTAGKWHHLTLTYSGGPGGVENVYVDGALAATEAKDLIIHGPGDGILLNFNLGAAWGGSAHTLPFSGSVAQLRVHGGNLSAADVAGNYANDAPAFALPVRQPTLLGPAGIYADWQFAARRDGSLTYDGMNVGNTLYDARGNVTANSTYETPHYASFTPGTSTLVHDDGWGLRTGGNAVGEGYIYFAAVPALSINTNFSIWGRFQRLSDLAATADEYIFSRPGAFDIRVDADGTLAASFGGLGGDTGIGIPVGQWLDVAATFQGIGNDALADTLRLYLNGSLVATFTGTANFGTGDWLHIGAGPGGGNDFHAVYDRVIFWNTVADEQTIAALSVPEPASLILLGLGGGFLGRYVRRRR